MAALAAAVFAALMIFQRTLYGAAICFLAVILQAAALLFGCGAKLLALLLVLIYAGAMAVLIVVSIQTAQRPGTPIWSRSGLPRSLVLAGFLIPLAEAAALLLGLGAPQSAAGAGDLMLGRMLFGPYAIASEAVALLILFAALAVI